MKTIKNQLVAIAGFAIVLGLAQVGARAEDTNAVTLPPVVNPPPNEEKRPVRPERPPKVTPIKGQKPERPSISDINDIVKNFQDQKKELIKQQHDNRAKVREELTSKSATIGSVRKELKDSINDAKRQALEQGRKLAEEAKEAAKEDRKRD